MNTNYCATIVKIKYLRKHENADKLQIANIFGNSVIVGLNVNIDDIGIFWPLESKIGKDFAEFNDLIRRKDENGKNVGGMFDSNLRVRALKLRGEKSMGFYMPIEALEKFIIEKNINVSVPEVGESFEKIGEYEISKKYELPIIDKNKKSKSISNPIDNICAGQFNFHYDTKQFGNNTYKIKPDDLIAISWKLHGTSSITSKILIKRKLNIIEKFIDYFNFGKIIKYKYDTIFSSRKVIKNNTKNSNFYDEDIWTVAGNRFKELLYNGESIYYEIVGYLSNGKYIQKDYDYSCNKGEYDIYVYRMTMTNDSGNVIEYPWPLVKKRCNEMGIKYVPEIYYGKSKYLIPNYNQIDDKYFGYELLKRLQSLYIRDQNSIYCKNKVPEEGIVIRHEKEDSAYKIKSFSFYDHETKQLDNNITNIEDDN